MNNIKVGKAFKQAISCLLMLISFFTIDFSLRFFTRWLGYYSIFELAPSLFTLCWSVIFLVIISLLPRKIGKITYVIFYGCCSIYAIIQYIYYLIFDKFFFVSDIRNASEGANYINYVSTVIDIPVFIMIIRFIILGASCFFLFPVFNKGKFVSKVTVILVSGFIMTIIPFMYKENSQALFFSSKYEYDQFTNSGFDMEIAGFYHYVARDVWKHCIEPKQNVDGLYDKVEKYMMSKNTSGNANEMTNVFEGKNIIVIQMESIDDWILTEETMPTVSKLMSEGIQFNNMYTCLYGSGWTFSTEFAFNTGVYQSTTGTAAYSMTQNSFPYSIANMLKEKGYLCRSYHQNTGNFYSRSSIHPTLGFEKYVSTSSVVSPNYVSYSDISMVDDNTIWEMMTEKQPFFNFIITYGAHVPYSADDELVQWALSLYPEYDVEGRDSELNVIYAKARTLDDMFATLMNRLKKDGLLENTVIVAYADHYCYGVNNKSIVHTLSEANGTTILERTPAFIWYEGCESQEINKVCQTIDWVPTIANFYGLDVTPYVMGNDIFDNDYEGYAIFPDGTWLTNDAYIVNGIVRWNNGMSDEEIINMNSFVQKFYEANEAILASDYYGKLKN